MKKKPAGDSGNANEIPTLPTSERTQLPTQIGAGISGGGNVVPTLPTQERTQLPTKIGAGLGGKPTPRKKPVVGGLDEKLAAAENALRSLSKDPTLTGGALSGLAKFGL